MKTRTLSDGKRVSCNKWRGRKVEYDEQILDEEYTEKVHEQAACGWDPC